MNILSRESLVEAAGSALEMGLFLGATPPKSTPQQEEVRARNPAYLQRRVIWRTRAKFERDRAKNEGELRAQGVTYIPTDGLGEIL